MSASGKKGKGKGGPDNSKFRYKLVVVFYHDDAYTQSDIDGGVNRRQHLWNELMEFGCSFGGVGEQGGEVSVGARCCVAFCSDFSTLSIFVVFDCLKCGKLDLNIWLPKEIDAPRCWHAGEQRGCHRSFLYYL
ncbi:hypothetical protein AAHA92_33235 [Salvia divinorum]|uniref:Uncharacterized protein n=1 Tax=Salvia divinorum TaxID=28513 RepID=A0ABD1FNC7_SALDI